MSNSLRLHAACQASLSFSISWSLFNFMSIESVMPSNLLILCCPLLLLPSIFPSITYSKDHKRLCYCPWSLVRSCHELHVVKKKNKTLSQANHLNCLGETTFTWVFQGQAWLFSSLLSPVPLQVGFSSKRNIRF